MRTRGMKVGLVMLVLTGTARADDEPARHAFEEGVALEKKGDYAAALDKFRASLAIKATLGNRYHAAYCLEMSGKLAAAFDEYETVESLAQTKPDVLSATRARLTPLRDRIATVTIHVTPSNATVLFDDAELAEPLAHGNAFHVDLGAHTFVARAARHTDAREAVTLAPGERTIELTATIPIKTEAPPLAVQSRPEPPVPSEPNTLAIVATGGAVALAAAGFAFFGLAGGAQSDAEQTCPLRRSCDDEQHRVRTLDAVSLGSFIGAAAATIAAVVLWSRPRDHR